MEVCGDAPVPAVVTDDEHHIRVRLGDARGDRAHANLGHELHTGCARDGSHSSSRESTLEISRWSKYRDAAGANQTHARRRVTHLGNPGPDFLSRQLAAPSPGFAPWAILI